MAASVLLVGLWRGWSERSNNFVREMLDGNDGEGIARKEWRTGKAVAACLCLIAEEGGC